MSANIRPAYIAAIALAYFVSLASWSRLPEPCGPDCSMGLARTLIAFALPTAILVVVVFLGVLWNRDPIRDRDATPIRRTTPSSAPWCCSSWACTSPSCSR